MTAKQLAGMDDEMIGEGTRARARVMAAAPDLLQALHSFLRAPHIGSDGPGSCTIVVQEYNLRAARAAIDKATHI